MNTEQFKQHSQIAQVGPSPGFTGKFPATAAQWAEKYPAITAPTGIWTCQEASGNLIDQVGAVDLAPVSTPTYQNVSEADGRLAVLCDAGEAFAAASSASFDPDATTNISLWSRCFIPDNGATAAGLMGKYSTTGIVTYFFGTSGFHSGYFTDGTAVSATDTGNNAPDGAWHDVMLVVDRDQGELRTYFDARDSPGPGDISARGSAANAGFLRIGSVVGFANCTNGTMFSYFAAWAGTAITFAEFTTMRNG